MESDDIMPIFSESVYGVYEYPAGTVSVPTALIVEFAATAWIRKGWEYSRGRRID